MAGLQLVQCPDGFSDARRGATGLTVTRASGYAIVLTMDACGCVPIGLAAEGDDVA